MAYSRMAVPDIVADLVVEVNQYEVKIQRGDI